MVTPKKIWCTYFDSIYITQKYNHYKNKNTYQIIIFKKMVYSIYHQRFFKCKYKRAIPHIIKRKPPYWKVSKIYPQYFSLTVDITIEIEKINKSIIINIKAHNMVVKINGKIFHLKKNILDKKQQINDNICILNHRIITI